MEYSFQDMLAQKLFVGIPNKNCIQSVLKIIKKYHIGGVILYKNNYDSLEEMVDLINKLKQANSNYNIPLTIAIDQEGGRVNRLPKEFINIKSSFRQCQSGDECVIKASSVISKLLKNLGVNMNFAPVLDVRKQKDDNAFIGNRAFSTNVEDIEKCGKIWCDEMIKAGIIPVIKHFPGHGSLNVDSHFFLPVIKEYNEAKKDLLPFKNLMNNNTPAIMVAHILIKGKTGLKPATLSKRFIKDYIREKLKYNGLIVTDELGMRAVRILYGKMMPVKLAYEATNDIICIKYQDNYVERILKVLMKDNKINHSDVELSFNKIVKYKKDFNYNDDLINSIIDVDKINKQIKIINEMAE